MSRCDWHKSILIGMILICLTGVVFTSSVKSQDIPHSVTPLSTVSIYIMPKEPEPGQNSSDSQQITSSNNTDDNTIPIPIPEEDVVFEKVCDPTNLGLNEDIFCTIIIKNNSTEEISYKLLDFVSKGLVIEEDSVVGGDLHRHNVVSQRGVLEGGMLPSLSVENADSPLAYNSLRELGIPALTDVQDEAMINVATLEPYVYAGEEYSTIGIASNGYLIPGLGSDEDIAYLPQIFPDPTIPNNVVAPFWTDLNPEAGGSIYAALLTRDGESWVVIEWENVPSFDSEKPILNCVEDCNNQYTFQAWLKTNTTEQDVTFIYERVDGEGSASGLNIGVEDKDGIVGANYEAMPVVGDELVVVSTPGIDGESHEISYTAQAEESGHWFGCALAKVYPVRHVAFDCVYGMITE